ncbi:MAG: RluA family pseudouridine synthase [Bacteroidales bacterium]|nr:RluA family pseudouridine synthase [Bacteroidales bacterium]
MSEENQESNEKNELYEHYRFDVDPGQEPLRIDKFLMSRIENATRNKIQQAVKADNVLVNEALVKSNYKVRPNDVITIVLTYPPRDTKIYAEDIPINIVYEDDDIIVVNKQAGMVVHPGHGNFTGTLLHALKFHFEAKGEETEGLLVHRIDKDTTGIMVVAKNEIAQAKLAKQFFDHSIERKYQAIVWGNLDEEEGTIEGNIGRNPSNRLQMTVFPDGEQGRHAITHYKLIRRFGYVTLIECQLETGRTHQIRAHLKYINHTLFNDARYGGDQILKGTTFTKYRQFVNNCFKLCTRQALHAKSIGFIHPTTKEALFFESDLAQDMAQVVDKWEVYSQHVKEQ